MTIQCAGGPRLCGGRLDLESMFEKILLRSILKCFENWAKKDFNDVMTMALSANHDKLTQSKTLIAMVLVTLDILYNSRYIFILS